MNENTPNASTGLPMARRIGLFLGPIFMMLTIFLPAPSDMSSEAWAALGLLLFMATWWSTEAIPIPATALLPICLIPALGLGTIKEATAPYANPLIFLFLGGFALGLSMQRWNLHRRIALVTLRMVGSQPRRQIAGFMAATAFLSMWVSNTATTIMMLPIGLSILHMMKSADEGEAGRFAKALLLAIAYSASVGGIATLIGTPPNALLAGYLLDNHDITVGFLQWMLIGVPIATIMLFFIWWWLTLGGFALESGESSGALIREQLQKMGSMSTGEKRVGIIFLITAAAWISQPLLSENLIPWLDDTTIAIAAAIVLFLTPVDLQKREFVLDWDTAQNIPWGVLLLFGGGLAMAAVIASSGLAGWIAESLTVLDMLPTIFMIAVVGTVIIFLTEVTSNTATAAAFLPLMGALAIATDVPPELYTVPAAIAASCAFMMPVATPPNAIVFAGGQLEIGDMIRAGFVLNLIGIVVVTLLGYLLMGWVFGI
ncbi:DASS family sodium-coupled anion symporter [Allohahella marinimesophila]|uniref:DASS family sodium-coupled anion symporter n=1 Tax=Allohahella marinimesophila TaxID=1054972 RepID=A0ABP7PG71_9GAMM